MSSSKSAVKILLVDDDSPLLEATADLLRSSLNADVRIAASVPAALHEIDENGPFDVIVSDYQMPPHTAHDLADHMKKAHNETPFIIHSGFASVDESKFEDHNYLGLVSKTESKKLTLLIAQHFPHAKKTV